MYINFNGRKHNIVKGGKDLIKDLMKIYSTFVIFKKRTILEFMLYNNILYNNVLL